MALNTCENNGNGPKMDLRMATLLINIRLQTILVSRKGNNHPDVNLDLIRMSHISKYNSQTPFNSNIQKINKDRISKCFTVKIKCQCKINL